MAVLHHLGHSVSRWRAHKRIAWLAFAAMWLLMAAPVISQVLVPSSGMHGMAMPDMAMHCDEHPGDGSDPSPQPHAPSLAKCGYCDLLCHSPVMGSAAWLPPAAPPSPYRLLPFASAPRSPRLLSLAAAPRGPPVNTNA